MNTTVGANERAAGYLGLTHPDWCETVLRTSPRRCAFWRGSDRAFKVLRPGAPFFFLRNAGARRPITDRMVVGFADYVSFETCPVADLTRRYTFDELGVSDENALRNRLQAIAGRVDPRIGVILLGPVEPFRHPIAWGELSELGIPFARQLVQGKGLDKGQVERLLARGGRAE